MREFFGRTHAPIATRPLLGLSRQHESAVDLGQKACHNLEPIRLVPILEQRLLDVVTNIDPG